MRYRVTDYKITVNEGFVLVSIPATDEQVLEGATTRPLHEAIRLIVDETAAVVFCSSMQKSNILSCAPSLYEGYWSIQFAIPAGKTITADDQFTIEMDWGTDMDSALQQLETNLKDYMADLKQRYSARFEQNNDGQDTYTMVMPMVAGVEEESEHTVVVTI